MKEIIVIGAGLAGSEAALQIAKRGIKVKLQVTINYIFMMLWHQLLKKIV